MSPRELHHQRTLEAARKFAQVHSANIERYGKRDYRVQQSLSALRETLERAKSFGIGHEEIRVAVSCT